MKRQYSAQEMQQAQREMQDYASARVGGGARIGSGGRLARQIHPKALRNAVNQNGIGVLKDREYWKDMERLHPEIAVPYEGDVVIGSSGGGAAAPRTRYGRVKERIVFRNGQKIVQRFD